MMGRATMMMRMWLMMMMVSWCDQRRGEPKGDNSCLSEFGSTHQLCRPKSENVLSTLNLPRRSNILWLQCQQAGDGGEDEGGDMYDTDDADIFV